MANLTPAPPPPDDPRALPLRPTQPPSLRRFKAVYWSCFALALGGFTWQLVRDPNSPGPGPYELVVTALAVVIAYRFARARIVRRFLRPHAAFICPRCHYPLTRLPDQGACPECGTAYSRAAVVNLWETTYRPGRRFPRATAPGSHLVSGGNV